VTLPQRRGTLPNCGKVVPARSSTVYAGNAVSSKNVRHISVMFMIIFSLFVIIFIVFPCVWLYCDVRLIIFFVALFGLFFNFFSFVVDVMCYVFFAHATPPLGGHWRRPESTV